jgi:hypothetical protein
VSARDEHEKAQAAVAKAQADLADLHARIEAGDKKVVGSDLVAAQAEVDLAGRRATATAANALEEQAAEDEANRGARIAQAKGIHGVTSKQLASAIATARQSMAAVLIAAQHHAANTAANLSGIDRHEVYLPTPKPEEVLLAVQVLAQQDAGQRVDYIDPHFALEPLLPFLPAES